MSEEMKLLMALCDALGFGVETTYDRKERKVTGTDASRINSGIDYPDIRGLDLECEPFGQGQGRLVKDDQGMYTAFLHKPITSYKLTRIKPK